MSNKTNWTLVLSLGVAIFAAPAAWAPVVPTAQAADTTPADWEKQWDRKLKEAAKKYISLSNKCAKVGLERTGSMVRRHALRYQGEDSELRSYFGYEKREGEWVVANEIVRDQLKALIDDADPNNAKFQKTLMRTHDTVAKLFKGLAAKATRMARDDAENKSKWEEFAIRGWQLTIESAAPGSKLAVEGHKALGHPKFGGKYVWPEYLDHVKARKESKLAGEAIAAKEYPTEPIEPEGLIVEAGFSPQGMKSKHFVINSTHGVEHAKRLAMWAERAVDDMIDRYGLPENVRERHGLRKLDILKGGDDELRQYLMKGAKWEKRRVDTTLKRGIHGTSAQSGTYVAGAGLGASADDIVIHRTSHAVTAATRALALADVGPHIGHDPNSTEPWLDETITSDVSRRLTANVVWRCISFGRYGNDLPARPGTDVWISLARRQVVLDNDVDMKDLWRKPSMNELDGPSTVKGYAMVQFLFEDDAVKAQKFIWHALAHGTPAGVVEVYGDWLGTPNPGAPDADAGRAMFMQPEYTDAMDELDRRYRKWILRSYDG